MKKKIISLLLVWVMTLTLAVPAFAAEGQNYEVSSENELCLEDGSTVEASTLSNGNVYLRQYINGQLIEEAFIAHGSTEVVSTRYINGDELVEVLDANECLEIHSQNAHTASTNALITKGNITYENSTGEHTTKVQYSSDPIKRTTYTIKSGTYTVIQIAGLLIGGLGISDIISSEIAIKIFNWLGFSTTVAGTFLGNETYSSDLTTYTYYLTDVATNFINTMKSEKYVIHDDVNTSHNSEVFWVGFNPETCWGDFSFGTEVYWHLYGDLSWRIVRWS